MHCAICAGPGIARAGGKLPRWLNSRADHFCNSQLQLRLDALVSKFAQTFRQHLFLRPARGTDHLFIHHNRFPIAANIACGETECLVRLRCGIELRTFPGQSLSRATHPWASHMLFPDTARTARTAEIVTLCPDFLSQTSGVRRSDCNGFGAKIDVGLSFCVGKELLSDLDFEELSQPAEQHLIKSFRSLEPASSTPSGPWFARRRFRVRRDTRVQ
jgi:hypothetical protein